MHQADVRRKDYSPMADGELGRLAADIRRIRMEIADAEQHASESWQSADRYRAAGGMLPDAEAQAAIQAVLRQRYQAQINALAGQLNHAQDKYAERKQERNEQIREQARFREWLAQNQERVAMHQKVWDHLMQVHELCGNDFDIMQGLRDALATVLPTLDANRRIQAGLQDATRRLAELGDDQ
jgi:chromosome segregation ATPase